MEPEKVSFCPNNPKVQIVKDSRADKQTAEIFKQTSEKFKPDLRWKTRICKIPSLGIVLGILSSFSFSVAIMLVKVINGVDPMFFVMCRGIIQFFLFAAVTFYQGPNLDVLKSKTIVVYLLLSGVFGSTCQVLGYASLAYIPLADATAILLSAPVFVSFFACILLKEKCGVFQAVTVGMAVLGVLLVCRPSFIFGDGDQPASASDHLLGTMMVSVGCLAMAAVYITLRKIIFVPVAVTNATLAFFSFAIGLTVFLANGRWHTPHCGKEAMLLVTSACMGTLGMLLFVLATKVEDAGPLSVARTSEIVFAFIWQMALLGHIPSWTTLSGAGAIVSSVVLIGMHKWHSQNPGHFGMECCPIGHTSRTGKADVAENVLIAATAVESRC